MAYVDMAISGFPTTSYSARHAGYIKPLGVRTFLRTGLICSNGAEMWEYVDGIPGGTLRGLAPGITTDAKAALDPVPVMSAVFGTAYPVCKYVTRPVGDQSGALRNRAGKSYVENPELVVGGQQSRWVKDTETTITASSKTIKTQCPDGFPIVNHKDQDCTKPRINNSMQTFVDYKSPDDGIEMIKMIFLATGVLAAVCIAHNYFTKK
jgi:hypothetical protein